MHNYIAYYILTYVYLGLYWMKVIRPVYPDHSLSDEFEEMSFPSQFE